MQQPSGQLMLDAARFNESLSRLSGFAKIGLIPKGVYRFKTHEAANRQDEECLTSAMVRIALLRDGGGLILPIRKRQRVRPRPKISRDCCVR